MLSPKDQTLLQIWKQDQIRRKNIEHLLVAVTIPEYKLFSKNRLQKRGGVFVPADDGLGTIKAEKLRADHYCSIQIKITDEKTNTLRIGVVYRSPKQKEDHDIALYSEMK